MNEFDLWHERNSADLAGRLAWLRERLGWRIEAGDGASVLGPPRPAIDGTRIGPGRDAGEDLLAPPAFVQFCQRIGLSPFEGDVLLLCAAMELDPRLPALCAQACRGREQPYPTFALALDLFDDARWDALSPHRPLRRFRLIEICQPSGTPLIAAALRADERIVNYLKGLNELDDRLRPMFVPWDQDLEDVSLPASQARVVGDVLEAVTRPAGPAGPWFPPPVVQLTGSDRASKHQIAWRVAGELGRRPVRLPVGLLSRDLHEQETLLCLWERESLLLPVCLYVDAVDATPEQTGSLQHFLARVPGLVFLDTLDSLDVVGRAGTTHDVEPPSAAEQRALWQTALGIEDEHLPSLLATQFRLDAAAILDLAAQTADAADGSERADRLWRACRRRVRPRLDQLARRVDVKAAWEDLVLPDEQAELLREIVAHVRHRGRVYTDWGFDRKLNRGLGVSVLFAGESGTGKTMAAEVIAGELDLDLYRIDLSAVVNKYIGETEKNLRKVFDAAEAGGVVLFFDEADALFGKRTEVKDSHDRYANIEVNYLLQRMEAFRGLAILATNLKSTLDQAFLRRLRYVVDFPVPDRQQRQEIWRRAFPVETPLSGVDFGRLAQLPLTGGNIHTIAVNAAFGAAGDAAPVDMPHVLRAARTECRKLHKAVSGAEFRWERTNGGRGQGGWE